MNILCYGRSAERQKEHCEFFQGTGCCADWATELDTARALLSASRFDSVVFSRSIPIDECRILAEAMHSISPRLKFFSLAAVEDESSRQGSNPVPDQDKWSSLVLVYQELRSRRLASNA